MKILLALMILSAAGLNAKPPESVTVSAVAPTDESVKNDLPSFAVYAMDSLNMELEVDAPLGSHVTLIGDVLQVAGGITATLAGAFPLTESLDFSQQTHQVVRIKIPLQNVKNRSDLLVRISSAQPDQEFTLAGQFQLHVFPKNDFKEFKSALSKESGDSPLHVFGVSKSLRAFLDRLKIPYRDEGEHIPGTFHAGNIYVGDARSEDLAGRLKSAPKARVVYFNSEEIAGIYRTLTPVGSVTKVTLPILENLESNPVSQKTFTDVILQSLPSPP